MAEIALGETLSDMFPPGSALDTDESGWWGPAVVPPDPTLTDGLRNYWIFWASTTGSRVTVVR